MSGKIDRRNFLKVMGLGGVGTALSGCDLPSTVTLEEGKEEVVSYLMPEEYVIPGVGVWYASTCLQCSAHCGTQGRVREGRVLKLEGNENSPINHGKLCMMGQAGLQSHYNPDRIKQPMLRQGGKLTAVSWEQAMSALGEKLKSAGNKVAWVTGTVSGHQSVLINNMLNTVGSTQHYSQEVIHNAALQAVNRDMFGESMPRFRIDKAQMIVSFGADFLGTWVSPVHFAGEYAKFRMQKQRGLLIQIEPKMTVTGGNADLWIASKPGSEALIALAIADELISKHNKSTEGLSPELIELIKQHSVDSVAKYTSVDSARIAKVAKLLAERSPSLVLSGGSVEGQQQAYNSTAAIMLLNHLLGNIGTTIESSGTFPFEQLVAKTGSTASMAQFAQDAKANKIDIVFINGANPVYNAPAGLDMAQALKSISTKVAVSMFLDETASQADIVLPAASYLEDWGTHVAAYQAQDSVLSMQQPLMEKLYADTKGLGDLLIDIMKSLDKAQYDLFEDYYAYLKKAHDAMPADLKGSSSGDTAAWQGSLQKGVIAVAVQNAVLNAKPLDIKAPAEPNTSGDYPLTLIPSPRLGLWDGRHANIPWLQEAPDQISKVVWDSWMEIHPSTAAKLGISKGSIVKVASKQGELTVKAVLQAGIHPDAVAIPMGQGHESFGRYATGLGVNPMKLVEAKLDEKTGEVALQATSVKVSNTNEREKVVHLGSSDTQRGRKFVVTVPVEKLKRT